ncbi:T9SS type B sorting domain-containing protein [Flavobacterium sp.]|uniref:T9SS type B sorting domain-containing protein n=1 Tax=Flavobacterium sp. TaxID=239 RepID=UPI003527E5B1
MLTDSVTSCTTTLTNTATISVLSLPTADMSTTSNLVCLNGMTTLTFTGTPNATVSFTDGTTVYTETLDGTGYVAFTTPMLTTTTTYTLTSVVSSGTPSCTVALSDSETISITPTPAITSIDYDAICDGDLANILVNMNNATGFQWQATLTNVTYNGFTNGDDTNINQVATLTNPLQQGFITFSILPVLTGGNCSGSPETIIVYVNPVPVITDITITPDTASVCSGESVTFTVSGDPSGITYNWTAVLNGVSVVDGITSGTTTTGIVTLTVASTSNTTAGDFYVSFTPQIGSCVGLPEDSDSVTVNPIPGSVIQSDYTICSDTSLADVFDIQLNFPLVANTGVEWFVIDASSNVSGYSDGSLSAPPPFVIPDVLSVIGDSQGYVHYRVWTVSPSGCRGEYEDFMVYVNPIPNPTIEDGSLCIDDLGNVFQTYWLQATGNYSTGNYEFVWYDANDAVVAITTVPQLEVNTTGSYYVLVTNLDTTCEGVSNTAVVNETTPATIVKAEATDYFSDNATIVVNTSGSSGTLQYQLDDSGYQDSNVFTNVSTGDHTITVIDTQGCTFLETTVRVIDYPKFFTPNGDGYNDTWNIAGLNQPEAKLYIFDRYGKLLKQLSATDDSLGWDGTFNGQLMPSTDYWFSLEYVENNVAKEFKAHFSLKR